MNKTIEKTELDIPYLQYINEDSQAVCTLPNFATNASLLHMYRLMSLIRSFDTKLVNLQRTGKIGTFPCARGQEAVGVGIGHAMDKDDIFCPYYRDQGVFIQRNVSLVEILQYWGGFEQGNCFKHNQNDLPCCVPIATQCLHAAGVAFAIKYRKQPHAVVTTCGEGATSKGDFYEAVNLAGAWNLPLVIVVNNNQWAISVPRHQQTIAKTIAQKAIAGGVPCLQVDGNDVVAVRQAVTQALEHAKSGKGPTLIEAITYRLCDHTTVDDASRYQPADEVKAAWKKEPIARLAYYLQQKDLWSKQQEQQLQQELTQQVEQVVKEFIDTPIPKATSMFDHLYAELPEAFLDQYDQLGE